MPSFSQRPQVLDAKISAGKRNVSNSTYQNAEQYGVAKIGKSALESFMLAVFAGAFIALAFVFYITVTTGATGPWGLIRLAGGLAFSLGLILVVVAGGELFTSTVLTSVAWAQKRISSKTLAVVWARVFVGNLVGAIIVIGLVFVGGMHQLDGGAWGLNALHIAQHKLHHTWGQAFALGILCNMLVCLGVWMTFATKDVLTKVMLLILPVAMFVSSGFEHSIANLFMVPYGILVANFAGSGFFDLVGVSAAEFSDLTLGNFVSHNLFPVVLGNIVGGGVFVGLGYWLTQRVNQTAQASQNPPVTAQVSKPTAGLHINDVMNQVPITLHSEQSVFEGFKCLNEAGESGAPVLDAKQRLIGYVTQQDLLKSICSQADMHNNKDRVADIIQR
ncbi:formate transporter FocA [Shewanella sp. Isolate11]|uniref:formate transporter FocA n=1 Tax=Shewanella sp. Isolate11 TaxID=2908530 RepID=UPI001EFDE901|nr:formate transporter FocA [Shewanella sp. Isolate11]MCG9696327.1 formate transporter FocA [Shewanella sp. Isolate11]